MAYVSGLRLPLLPANEIRYEEFPGFLPCVSEPREPAPWHDVVCPSFYTLSYGHTLDSYDFMRLLNRPRTFRGHDVPSLRVDAPPFTVPILLPTSPAQVRHTRLVHRMVSRAASASRSWDLSWSACAP
jgi:hypothetical protein